MDEKVIKYPLYVKYGEGSSYMALPCCKKQEVKSYAV
jgi:hypothetical protein